MQMATGRDVTLSGRVVEIGPDDEGLERDHGATSVGVEIDLANRLQSQEIVQRHRPIGRGGGHRAESQEDDREDRRHQVT